MLNQTGSERETLVRWLMTRPDLLGQVREYGLAQLLRLTVPVSEDGQLQADLLLAWINAQPRFSTVAHLSDQPRHTYLRLNWDGMAHCGKALSVRRGEQVSTQSYDYLIDGVGLAKADGSPNLRLIPVLTYGLKLSGHRPVSDVGALIEKQLESEDLTGDRKAQWLVAKAMFEENDTDDEPNAFAGRRSLELAFAAAESEAVRFWVLNEHAGRLAAMGAVDELESLLAAVGDQFSTQEQLASQADWRSAAERWASDFERANDRQAVDRQQELITSLQERLDAAVAGGDTNGQARYGALVTEAQRVLAEVEQEFEAKWEADE